MKRKIIALISSLFLLVPFITPVYADDITTYWDGSYIGQNPALNPLGQEVSYGGKRFRSNYKPTGTVILVRPTSNTNNNYVDYGMTWYLGEYSQLSNGTSDANILKEQLKVYIDTVANNATIYTTQVIPATQSAFSVKSVQVGTQYRVFLTYYYQISAPMNSPMISMYTGNAKIYRYGSNTSLGGSDLVFYAFKQIFGYDANGANNTYEMDYPKNSAYLITLGDSYLGFFGDNVTSAFNDGNIIEPSNGIGTGSNGNDSTGIGNGVPNGSGEVGSSTITFEGSDNQVQNQSQYQNQSIESNAVNVTVNNEISGGSGGGSGESDVDRINALDNLLSNQSVDTSFNEAIQNVNNFRQLGVAFADTATVFLGWLPSWVLALLGLMFTLLFFFIILRLLKVFHG